MPKTKDPVEVFALYDMSVGPDACWKWNGAWGGQPKHRGRRPYFMANGKRMTAYRWVYELVNGVTLTPDQMICHSCDAGDYPIGCGCPAHLSVGTHQENMSQMTTHQRHGLPHSVVRAIRTLLSQGKTQQEIATTYGVSRETISAIATHRVYRHVSE